MKSGIPWSVKGIEPEVREAAKDAARRSGLTLGEWLNSLILEQSVTATPAISGSIHPRVRDRFESITEELAMMTVERPQTTAGRYFEQARPFADSTIDFDKVLERVENNERYLNEALGSINERLKVINTQLAQQGEPAPDSGDKSASYTALETAVRNIVSHLEISERRGQDALKAIQDQISGFSRKDSEAPDYMARIQQIEHLIAELAKRLEGQDQNPGKERVADLELEVARLADRLGSLQGSTETLVAGAKSTALTSARVELREFEQHLQSLAAHVQSSLKQSTASQAEIIRLKADIGSINKRIDEISSETASERELHSLRSGVEQLSSRIAELPVDDLEQRLNDITRRVTEVEIRGRALPQISEVEQRVYELEGRLAESNLSVDAQGGLDGLQEQINQMADRLAGTEDQLSAISRIERSVSQLFQTLEDNREDAHEIAEEAAGRAAQRFLQHAAAPASGPSPELVTLEEALAAVKQHSAESDRQTQETLDAVHDTLEVIINKLAELETDRVLPEENRVGEHKASSPPSATLPSSIPSAMEAAAEVQGWQSAVQYHLASTQRDLAGQPPLDGETLKGDDEPAKDFFVEREPIVEFANLVGANSIHAPAEDDFIAAARRAAQAAAQGSRLGMGRFPYTGTEPDATRPRVKTTLPKLSFSFFRKAPALKPRHPRGLPDDIAAAADAATLPQESGRRRLLLAALLLLAAVSAYALRSGQKETEPPIRVPQSERETGAPALVPAAEKGAAINPLIVTQPQAAAEPLPLPSAIGPEALRLAATNGEAQAQFVIAGRYLDGSFGSQNFSEAAKWYSKAARQGLAPAQYRLATLFERGTGVLQSTEKAKTWYEKAAAQGNVKAMHNLGVLLAGEKNPDYARAAHWFAVAAEYGLKDSQYNMAILYERGLGVSEEPVEAYFWYSVAANQGDQDALAKAKAIEGSLPLKLKSTAWEQLRQWKPKEAEKDANAVLLALGQG